MNPLFKHYKNTDITYILYGSSATVLGQWISRVLTLYTQQPRKYCQKCFTHPKYDIKSEYKVFDATAHFVDVEMFSGHTCVGQQNPPDCFQ